MRTEEELMHGLWNEQEATLAANASRLKKKRVAIVAAVIVVAVAALFITMRAFAAGPTQVSTWAQFQQAYQNTDVSSIQLTANITRGTSDSVLSNGGFELNRSLEISGDNGQGGNYTLNFGADATNTNAFDLGQATAGTGNVLNIHNLTIVHAGADYNDCVIYSSDNTNNSAGWTVKFADVNNGSSPSGAALVNCQDAPGDWMVSDGTPEGNGVNV
ncbi:MAG: hypothetical protein LBM21_03765, partial [Coriobacteriales bacterium]|nr:hypothetical protein [Coriobacteriales bacterium]